MHDVLEIPRVVSADDIELRLLQPLPKIDFCVLLSKMKSDDFLAMSVVQDVQPHNFGDATVTFNEYVPAVVTLV